MLDRLKRALTESYIGAVGLGWLLAEGIMQLVNAVISPLGAWATHIEFPRAAGITGGVGGAELALPGLARFFLILVIWYALVRWLYLSPIDTTPALPEENSEPTRASAESGPN